MDFKDNLYRIRKEKGLSQEELAMLCNVSRQAISKWENGTARADMDNLTILARSLNVSTDELLGNEFTDYEPVVEQFTGSRYTRFKSIKHFEYRSKLQIANIPLVHINFGSFKNDEGKVRIAKGIFAIGNISIGVFSLGLLSIGILSIGVLSIALLCAISVLAIAYFSIGAIAIGYISLGSVAIGIYSIGAISIGAHVSIGAMSFGDISIGVITNGNITYHLRNHNTCLYIQEEYNQLQQFLSNTSIPSIIRMLLNAIPKC